MCIRDRVKRHFQLEYGTDVDKFLDSLYQAGMDVDMDLASEKERVESINHSNKFLKLMDESVDLMRKYHPQGERYYWVLYYSYMSAYKAENVEEILDKLEPHCPQLTRVHRTTSVSYTHLDVYKRQFLIRQNMRNYIHYRWNIFFHSDFSRMYPGRHYNACVGQKIPVY